MLKDPTFKQRVKEIEELCFKRQKNFLFRHLRHLLL